MFTKGARVAAGMVWLAMAVVLVSSCKDDDDEQAKLEDHFTLGGTQKDLSTIVVFYDETPGKNNGTTYYRNEIVFISKTISIDQSSDYAKLSGEGDAISLEIVSNTEKLEAGTYTFTGDETNLSPFTIWSGGIYINYNIENKTGEQYVFTAGTVKVEKSDIWYTIALEGTVYPALYDQSGDVTGPDKSKTAVSVKAQYTGDTLDYAAD